MTRYFFITGLPRSRTAWLANLFCTPHVVCHHQYVGTFDHPRQWIAKLYEEADSFRAVGDSGNLILAAWEHLDKAFPDASWVFVYRKPEDALKSYNALFTAPVAEIGDFNRRTALMKEAQDTLGSRALGVGFDDLHDADKVELIWRFCVGGIEPWNAERFKLLSGLNVTIDVHKHVASASKVIQYKFHAALAAKHSEVA